MKGTLSCALAFITPIILCSCWTRRFYLWEFTVSGVNRFFYTFLAVWGILTLGGLILGLMGLRQTGSSRKLALIGAVINGLLLLGAPWFLLISKVVLPALAP